MNARRKTGGMLVAGVTALSLVGLAGTALAAEPVADIPELTGQSTSVALDEGFTSALEGLGVEPGTVGDATIEDGSARFPITGGNVTVFEPGTVDPFVQGSIRHDGSGLSLTAGDTTVELTDFVVDPGNPATLTGTVSANGEVAAESAVLFDLDGSTLEPIQTDAEAGTATLTGTTVNLAPGAADLLNETFGIQDLEGGLTIGIATIVVNLPGQMGDMPAGGVETGTGSTGNTTMLIALGAGSLLAAGGIAVAVRRRGALAQR